MMWSLLLQINTTIIEPEKKHSEEELIIKKPEGHQTTKNIKNSIENTPQNTRSKRIKPTKDFLEPNRPSSIRKPLKRIRSLGPEDASPGKHMIIKTFIISFKNVKKFHNY